ncbi:CCR4-NOT core subunit cdc39 [Coemansia sp. RSA 522]|nr:CCR4-NOT core subunit cdc39 [Coemansia sp. RSA 522]
METNWTGPELRLDPAQLLPGPLPSQWQESHISIAPIDLPEGADKHEIGRREQNRVYLGAVQSEQRTELDQALLRMLEADGEEAYALTPRPLYLHFARVLLVDLPRELREERDKMVPSGLWWAARAVLAQQSLLDYPAQSLLDQIIELFDTAREYMPKVPAGVMLDSVRSVDDTRAKHVDEARVPQLDKVMEDEPIDTEHVDDAAPVPEPNSSNSDAWDNVSVADRELWARFLLELGVVYSQHSMPLDSKRMVKLAQDASGLQWQMTGARGKRTRFQTFDTTQLVLLAKSARRVDRDTHEAAPEALELNDDVLLEHLEFTDPDTEISNPADLQTIDKCMLLAFCLNVQNENPAHGLTSEQMLPFVTRVLQHTGNWSVYTMALLLRSRLERSKTRTVERATLQLQQLVDQITHPLPGSEEAGAGERMQYVFALSLPSQWALERELAEQFISLGVVRSALDIFERLQMWDDVISCYTMLGQTDVAERIVRSELEKTPDRPKLWCILGDLTKDPKHWHHAWEVSGHRYARAMRTLGSYNFAKYEFAESVECYENAVRLNPLYENSWYILGCASMSIEQWDKAARAFLHVVSIDENNGESWNNLATAYLRMGPEYRTRALHALREAVKFLHDSWRVWSNFMHVSLSLGMLSLSVQAMGRLVDLRAGKMGADCVDLDVLRSIISAVSHGAAFAGMSEADAKAKEQRLISQIDSLLVRKIEARITSSAPVWRAMADYWFWRNDFTHCLDCYIKAYRCISNMPQVSYAPPVFNDAVDAALELVSMYENFGEKTQVVRVPSESNDQDGVVPSERKTVAVEQLVCADWKHQAKMVLRGLIGKGKESFEGTPAYIKLVDALNELRSDSDSHISSRLFSLVSTFRADNFDDCEQYITELRCQRGHSVIVWYIRSLLLVHALLSSPDTRHLVSADIRIIESVIEGTFASFKDSSTIAGLLLQSVASLNESVFASQNSDKSADIIRHCVEHAAFFLRKDYWACLTVISDLAQQPDPVISQAAQTLLPPLLARLSEEKQKPTFDEQLLSLTIASLTKSGTLPLNHSSTVTFSDMGLAEQLLGAGSHTSATDIIAEYAHQNGAGSSADTSNKGTAGDSNGQQQGVFTPENVARALALLASSATDENNEWSAEEIAASLCKHCPSLSWEDVIYKLPYSNLSVKSEAGAVFIVDVFLAATAGQNRPFPYSFMYEIWPDAAAQVAFLRYTLHSSSIAPHLLDKHMPTILADPVDLLYKAYHTEFARILASPWNSLSLILVLSHLLDSKASDDARSLLEAGIAQEPLLVTLALARLKIQHPRLQALLQHNVARFLKRDFGHNGLFFELFRIYEKKMMMAFFCNIYRKDPAFSRYILDVLVDLGMANDLLLVPKRDDIVMLDFIVDLAVFASRRGMLSFETWFPGLLAELGSDMLHASLEIMHTKIQLEAARQRGEDKGMAAYSSAELTIMFKALGVMGMSPNNAANLKALYAQFVELVGELERTENECSSDEGQIEKEAESLFLRLYRGELSVDHMADTLEDLRDSLRIYMRKTYHHVIQYPLEEFSFFDNYPDKELTITGQLVGVLIQRHMLSPVSEPTILEMLVKALQSPASSKSFHFGMTALQACLYRIEQLPMFCTRLYQIPAFNQNNNAPAVKLIKSIIASVMPARNAKAGSGTDRAHSGMTPVLEDTGLEAFGQSRPANPRGASGMRVFQSVRPPPLPELDEAFAEPAEETKDKLQFAVNNLDRSSLEEKTNEVDKLLQPKHFIWFSQEIMVKRASQEPNYHSLYLQFVEALNRPDLLKCILRETLVSISRLLNAESTVNSSSDRNNLKNLGAWLGGMTLARDQPILRESVSFKDLLCEGYNSNRLNLAIPFVCKVLEQTTRSTVFHPPSPWLMSIMGVLAELYATANLKLILTFEVEVLCKALSLDVKDIPATSIVGRQPTRGSVDALASEFGKATIGGEAGMGSALASDGAADGGLAGAVQMPAITGADITVDILSVLSQHASFHAAESLFSQQPMLKKMFYILTERIIRKIIPVHVARSIYVAVSCTRDTIQKDFCGEPNEEHVHRAAQVMARGLAGALAVSLCREQLKNKLFLTMCDFLNGQALPEQSVNMIAVGLVADNLDLACAIAEKEAIERASLQIDTVLSESYMSRKRTRERTGQPFYDLARYSRLVYPGDFPELLKVRLNGLQAGHLRIYEDFTQIPHFFSQIGSGAQGLEAGVGRDDIGSASAGADGGVKFSTAQCFERFAGIIEDLDKTVSAAAAEVTLSQLPSQHEACLYARDILVLAVRSASPDDTAMDFAQALVNYLYRSETRLGIDLYVLLLARMCEMSGRVAKEVTSWLAFADDERKFNVAATLALIGEGLVSTDDEDGQVARLIEANRPGAVDFAVRLLRRVLAGGTAVSAQAFGKTAQGLAKLAQSGQASAQVTKVVEDLKAADDMQAGDAQPGQSADGGLAREAEDVPAMKESAQEEVGSAPANRQQETANRQDAASRQQETASYQHILLNWARVYDHPAAGEAELTTLVRQLLQQIPLHETRVEAAFFRACVEAVLAFYDQSGGRGGFQVADALVKLVVFVTRLGGRDGQARLQTVRMFLSSVTLVIVDIHETRPEAFGAYQRPFFRLLSGILGEAHAAFRAEEAWCSEQTLHAIVGLLGESLRLLDPGLVPGFSFVWLMLASHRFFLPRLVESRAGWALAAELLERQLRFLEPFVEADQVSEPVKLLYRGIVCVILVVLHDFPEFLASYALRLSDAVPTNCVQLRNLLLSAYPRDMRLPEPLTPNLKIDLLAEITQSPDIPYDHAVPLERVGLRTGLEAVLSLQRAPAEFASGVMAALHSDGAHYDVAAVNAFVLHALVRITQATDDAAREAAQRMALELFCAVLSGADPEGRYLVVSAIANQLRFPSTHTYLGSRMVLALFSKSDDVVCECIARVLVERILVNRPFPWGLLVTLIELLRNPFYAFWNHSFTRESPQIAEILTAVSTSIHPSDPPSTAA